MNQRIKILHLITGLNTGGAEMMLYRLLTATDRTQFKPVVVSLLDGGTLGAQIEALDVPVYTVGMKRTPLATGRLISLWRLLRRLQPDILQGWMYHANVAAALIGRRAGARRLAWGLHHAAIDPKQEKRMTLWIARLGARLSKKVDAVIACSESTRRLHESLGYCRDNMHVIPNGFDLSTFAPDTEAPARLRCALGLPADAFVVGLVARFDPQKDHLNFLRAARLFLDRLPTPVQQSVAFVLCGRNVDGANARLARWIAELGLGPHVRLLGLRDDVPALMAGLDVLASSSCNEALPLVIGEAMACGVPCVTTDVGDSSTIVADTGVVVPARSPEALAEGWRTLLERGDEGRRALGQSARKRIESCYSLSAVVRQYERLYREMVEHKGVSN